ncbi:hypothetical protein D9M69_478910 [compost metagenome]
MLEVVPLALPTGKAGPGHAVLRLQRLHVRGDLGLVEPEQRLALFHPLAFAHQNLADHAVAHRLHGLALARNHHCALYRYALIEGGQAGPGEETASADNRQYPAQASEVTRIASRLSGQVVLLHRRFVLKLYLAAAHTPELLVAG